MSLAALMLSSFERLRIEAGVSASRMAPISRSIGTTCSSDSELSVPAAVMGGTALLRPLRITEIVSRRNHVWR